MLGTELISMRSSVENYIAVLRRNKTFLLPEFFQSNLLQGAKSEIAEDGGDRKVNEILNLFFYVAHGF